MFYALLNTNVFIKPTMCHAYYEHCVSIIIFHIKLDSFSSENHSVSENDPLL